MFVANANVLRPNSYSQSEQNDLMKCNVVRSVGQFWSFWTVLKHGFLLCAAQRHSERNSCCWSCTKVYYICVYNLELTARRLMMTL